MFIDTILLVLILVYSSNSTYHEPVAAKMANLSATVYFASNTL